MAQVVREFLMGQADSLPEETGNDHLEDRVPGILDQEREMLGSRWGPCPTQVPSKSLNRTQELFVII